MDAIIPYSSWEQKKIKPVELAQAKFKAEIESSISSQRSLKT